MIAALAAAGAAGDVGAELVREVDFDPADRVDQVFEAGEVDDRDVVDLDVEELFDRLDLQGGAAEGVGGVDFLRRLAGDLGVAVAGDREFAEDAAAGPDQHQRVGAELALFAAVVGGVAVGLLFEALLRRRRPRLLGVGRAGVGAEDEDRLGARQQQRVAVQGVLRFAGKLERLQLGGDREGQEAEQDPSQSGDADPFEDALETGARRPRPAALAGLAILARPLARQLCALPQAREIGRLAAARRGPCGTGRPCSRAVLKAAARHLSGIKGLEIMAMSSVDRLPAPDRP